MTRRDAVRVIASVVLLVTCAGARAAQAAMDRWSTNGPYGSQGRVVALAMHPTLPTTLYAVADEGSGIFKSTDGGATWANKLSDGDYLFSDSRGIRWVHVTEKGR